MKTKEPPAATDRDAEITALIATLNQAERRLDELTGGEVDAVLSGSGQPFLLRHAQEERRLREAGKQIAILNALPAHIALLDAQGTIVSVNATWQNFASANLLPGPAFGIGASYLEICDRAVGADAAEAHRVAAGIRAVLGGAKTFSLEYQCQAPAEMRWFLMTVTPLTGTAVGGAVVMHLNITERKRAEEGLRESDERFAGAFEHAPIGVALVAPDGRWLKVNRALCELVGYSAAELHTRTFQEITHPADLALDLAQVGRMLAGEINSYQMEKRYIHARGHYVTVLLNVSLVRDGRGEPRYFISQIQDITDRKAAELALRESEQWLRAVFEQAAVGVVQTDVTTGRFLRVNQRFCDIVGYTREEIAGLSFNEITHPQDIAQNLDRVAQLRDGGIREFAQEKRYVHKDGSIIWTSVVESSIGPPGGPPAFFIAFVHDITARKRLDEHFLQAQKMEALGQFSGGVAHDFNNILATISGYTELSRMILTDNPEVQSHLGAVLHASRRAAELVNQILTFSRQQPQERQTIQLRPVVEESIKLLRATIPSTIEFDLSIAADAPTVLANANQIHQVLTNLGVNAWHAMQDRPGRLHLTLENWVVDEAQASAQPRLRPGHYARVSVADTGCGMDAATQQRMFEPFFTTKPPGQGTGLGLSVVHGIMDGHDGAVTVYSQPGEGTVFRLYFPEHAGEAPVGAIEEDSPPRGHGEVVLVVDDEEMIASMIQQTLIRLDYAAEFVTDPTRAFDLVRSDPARYKLVLSDQTMPRMTGLVLAMRLKEIRPELPVILMTGFSASLTAERLEAAGVRRVLFKPLTVQLLGAAVHAVLAAEPSATN